MHRTEALEAAEAQHVDFLGTPPCCQNVVIGFRK